MKIFFLFIWLGINVCAVQIQVKTDKNISVPNDEIVYLQQQYAERYMQLPKKGAEEIIRQNRLLSNAFIKEGMMTTAAAIKFRILSERFLANSYVKALQAKEKIPMEVLRSYYFDKHNHFKKPKVIVGKKYCFDSYNDAHSFFVQCNKEESKKKECEKIAETSDARSVDVNQSLNTMSVDVSRQILLFEKKGYVLPPYYEKDEYCIQVVDSVEDNQFYTFEEVKQQIETSLWQETFAKKRKEILSSIEGK
jgi:hypothetical protein